MSSPTVKPRQTLDLSTDSLKIDGKSELTQAATIRKTMKVDNLLSPAGDAPDHTTAPVVAAPVAGTPVMSAPSTPVKPVKEEVLSPPVASPDAAMSEPEDVKQPTKEASEDAPADPNDEAAEDLPDSEREFICMNDEYTRCVSGQYTKDLSRKVISDHFGRNKSCTREIQNWPLFCRKHYQRATYEKSKWQVRKVHLILRQLDVIEDQFPGTTYDVALKKSEESRLNQYCRQVNSGISSAEAEKNLAAVKGKHFEAPIDVLRELDPWLGRNKSCQVVKQIVDIILQMLETKDSEQVPAIEFLPQIPGKVETPVKARASAKSPKTPKAPKTPSHVSPKGAVKKTNRKA